MTTKRFLASDMSSALKKVREELGADAIILSSKRADKGVEIIATIDTTPPSAEKAAKKRFASSFDDEYDQPLASDTEWEGHHQAQRIAANTRVAATQSVPSKEIDNTPSKMSRSAAANAERLASDIKAAHERMLAAKRKTQGEPSPKKAAPISPSSESDERSASDSLFYQGMSQNRQVASFEQQLKERGIEDEKAQLESRQLHSLYDEIAEMRMLLEEQLWQKQHTPEAQASKLMGRARQLASQLEQLGLSSALVNELLVCADDSERLPNCWRKSLAMLARRLPIDAADPIEKGGTFAFIGPTGVGKTTTVAKLAARYVLNHGRGKVAIVTTDTYRVGAHDQLKALGRILQVPVRSIEGENQLSAVLSSLKQYELVLVDTAGFRHGDPKQAQQDSLLDACPGVQRMLVLAANSQQQILKASLHAYGGVALRGCIFTKLDECASLGEAFGAICSHEIPVIYTSAGQEIPDDIHVVSPTDLVAQAVKLARQYEGSFGQSSVLYGA